MGHDERITSAINEINMQLVNLKTRKAQLMKEYDERQLEEDSFFTESSYAGYLDCMSNKREVVDNPKVVYQGEPGAYSEIACRDFFGEDVNAVGVHQFEDAFKALACGQADYAVLPIENSSTGAIRQVYDQLEKYHFFFIGEATVQLKDPRKAAICSVRAAELYGLKILKERVNTNSRNTTRFIVISPYPELRQNRDKVCISLTTANNSGALHSVLTVFSVHNINLVRIESRPIPGRNWEYMFFIEFTGDLLNTQIDRVIHEISLISADLRVLGNFRSNLDEEQGKRKLSEQS